MDDFRRWYEERRDEIVAWRRDLHAHPELAFEETRTAAFVAERLNAWGLEVHTGVARTGVVAVLPGGQAPAIGLRADMDALPIEEANSFAHVSRHPGRMHACGHDGHTTMLLAAARYLAEHHARVGPPPGPIRFVFQPAEENEGGGRRMVEEGLFERFPMQSVFAMHNMPGLEVGRFMVRGGPVAAGFDTFDIVIGAPGGHAAMPAEGGDAVTAAAALALNLQTIVPRHVDANEAAILAVTRIHGGSAYNVLPDEMRLAGSVRWFNPKVRDEIRRRIEMQCAGLAQAYGVAASLTYQLRYPSVINAEAPAALAARAAVDVVGPERVATEFPPLMGSEDFAFLLERNPGAYLLLGNGSGEGGCLLHNPHFDFNDEAIGHGAALWVALCRRFFDEAQAG
ncbi:M20 aminoacylase family protein [Phenylobacterium sp.]|uniref:M20 aminoacylase family protein n=1 Tax=Phenylobacterium sp. TaxID=1871053 RepID=UPI0035B23EF3